MTDRSMFDLNYSIPKHNLTLVKNRDSESAIADSRYMGDRAIGYLATKKPQSSFERPTLSARSVLGDLLLYDAVLDINNLVQEAIDLFTQHPELPGILIRDRGRIIGIFSRQRFARIIPSPEEIKQYSYRSLHILYEQIFHDLLIIPVDVSINRAVEIALQRSITTAFEPILVEVAANNYRILGMPELLQAQAQIQAVTQKALEEAQAEIDIKTQQFQKTVQELKEAQLRLVQNEKMSALGKMVAGIAHEINNPISFIYGNIQHADSYAGDLIYLLDLYQKYYPNPETEIVEALEEVELDFLVEDLPKVLDSMKMGADRVREIVHSMRTFSRLDEAHKKAVDIHSGIDSTLLILQSRLKGTPQCAEINVVKNYGFTSAIECYAGQLNQVFMNALSNAIDALEDACQEKRDTEYQPQITITTTANTEGIAIAIADNGIGMSETVREKLFDPFFTTKPIGKGTGLGLSISYSIIVEKHHGQLECTSTPGEGTEFVIRIPYGLEG
ncbi:MAG: ATP-binding protein [Jaaginema sp. PMC 1080.18]|nr:ATP-binding protein [Jaaginema sp. PMC 1080.18]MEC4866361.1 ATP-binding protein [Jaaginema sp. PMC 1078.18]